MIVGGESGKAARPSHPEWIRKLRDLSCLYGAAFHFKQWGSLIPITRPMGGRYSHSAIMTFEAVSDI
ncbi:MAG: DUF5131 family protein [Ignavibacteriota bacterium]